MVLFQHLIVHVDRFCSFFEADHENDRKGGGGFAVVRGFDSIDFEYFWVFVFVLHVCVGAI